MRNQVQIIADGQEALIRPVGHLLPCQGAREKAIIPSSHGQLDHWNAARAVGGAAVEGAVAFFEMQRRREA